MLMVFNKLLSILISAHWNFFFFECGFLDAAHFLNFELLLFQVSLDCYSFIELPESYSQIGVAGSDCCLLEII